MAGRVGPRAAARPARRAALGALAATVGQAAAALAAAGAAPRAAHAEAGREAPWPAPVLEALRSGGHLLLMRHATTGPGVGDPPGFRLEECATQRNLSDVGRAQARRVGERLRAAGVPVPTVRSSRWCRCLETARLAFGVAPEPWPVLDSFFDDRSRGPAQTEALRRWALGWRGPGNAALVTHQVNVTALLGDWASMGDIVVVRADGAALQVVGRLPGAV